MRKRDGCWLAVGVVVGALGASAFVSIRGAAARDEAERKPAEILDSARELKQRREKVMSELVQVLSDPSPSHASPDERVEAIELLGDLHMSTPGTVAVLVDNVYFLRELPVPYSMTFPEPAWRAWPAFGALAKIGLPAIPPLVDQARTQQDKDKRRRSLFFLDGLVGEHAQSWLSVALRQERDQAARARLEEALQYRFSDFGAYGRKVWFFQQREGDNWY